MAENRKPAPRRRPHVRKKKASSSRLPTTVRPRKRPAVQRRRRAPSGTSTDVWDRLPRPTWAWMALAWRGFLIVLLSFLAVITTATFFESLSTVQERNFWLTAPVYFFLIGSALLFVMRWGFPDGLLYGYVFGHELTHVFFIYLCGGKVYGDIRVSIQGGHVVTNKTNWLIALSPYFVPFYTVIVTLGFLFARLFMDLSKTYLIASLHVQPLYLFYALIGFTWSMHFYFTLKMIVRDQPDLHMNGTVVSLLTIYLINSILVIGLVASASEVLTLQGFAESWVEHARNAFNLILIRIAQFVW